jgi:GT2 family glycosyltransferase
VISDANVRLTIVVLSYERAEALSRALASVVADAPENSQIIVVDNNSSRQEAIKAAIRPFQSRLQFIQNPVNIGFAGGMNTGLRLAKGEFTYFTEDDIVLEHGVLTQLVGALEGERGIGLVGPLMLNDQSGTIRFCGARLDIGAGLGSIKFLSHTATSLGNAPVETDFLPGASMLARTDLLRELGGFREDFFMYGEDVELCARVRLEGLRILMLPTARIRHIESAGSVTTNPLVSYHKLKNLFFLHVLHANTRDLPLFVIRYLKYLTIGSSTLQWSTRRRALRASLENLPRLLSDRRHLRRKMERHRLGSAP